MVVRWAKREGDSSIRVFYCPKNASSALHSFSFPLVSPPSPNFGLRHPLTCTVSVAGFPTNPNNFSIHAFASASFCRFKGFQIEDLVGLFFAALLLVRSEINMKELGNSWIEGGRGKDGVLLPFVNSFFSLFIFV
ncbi:uncharacterized protein LOC111914415 isoform X2 [Lactuca sativa]|uniref:uncharacterized protein LOC111914415 isoform X2 n=1 Tax=Lactuca sativa TaxID=4236 RepID=UPI001C68B8C4|nr:uncharacterized protein LOC111914415 isoform X2 [Lactuca sativa]